MATYGKPKEVKIKKPTAFDNLKPLGSLSNIQMNPATFPTSSPTIMSKVSPPSIRSGGGGSTSPKVTTNSSSPAPSGLPGYVPSTAYATSSAMYGQVSSSGLTEVPPLVQAQAINTGIETQQIPQSGGEKPPFFIPGEGLGGQGFTKVGDQYLDFSLQTQLQAAGVTSMLSFLPALAPIVSTGLSSLGSQASAVTSFTKTALPVGSNAATSKATISALSKLGWGVAAAALVKEIIGTYPFAGFIKEESLQTLGFATNSALQNNDLDGAEAAIAQQKEILNQSSWDKLVSSVPFVNVQQSLKEFNDAARIKLAIDEQVVRDQRIKIDTGESDEAYWTRVAEQQTAQEKERIDYYNNQRKIMLQWEAKYAAENREKEAAFWRAEAEKTYQREAADREAIARFWEEYRKKMKKINEDSAPSTLSFGLL